jgi:hypothetical protein
MKYLSILAWWLLLLFALQISALILDNNHYLFWGAAGIFFLKFCYLAYAGILFLRFLSFRSQRSYEAMLEAYNRIATLSQEPEKPHKGSSLNSIFLLALVVTASIDITLVFFWNVTAFRVSILLDTLVWMLTLRYVSRTYWLKSLGRREKIKAFLDDSRSKMKQEEASIPDLEERPKSATPFFGLAGLSLIATLSLSGWRWMHADRVFRIDDLKACMEKAMEFAAPRFYQHGQIDIELSQESCVQEKSSEIHFSLDLVEGELYLSGSEKLGKDFFGNGKPGDDGLVLDPSGRFRVAWMGHSTE